MKPNRLGYVALSAFSAFFLLGCPTPVDMHDPDNTGGSTGSRGGSTGSGTGGSSSNTGTGGSSSNTGTGGSTSGGTGGRAGSGGSSGGMGGRGGSAGSGMGGSMARGGAGGGTMDAAGGGMDASMATGTKLPPDIAAIFMMRCGTCHMDGGMSRYGDATRAYNALKAMAGAPCSRPRMMPGNGAMSLVVQSMKGMKPCGSNMKMPPGAAPAVPAADIMKVEQWITDGAKPVP